MYLSEEIVELAKRVLEPAHFQYIKTLDKFGVVGFQKAEVFHAIDDFLYHEKELYGMNRRSLIWSPKLSETLKKIFERP